MGRGTWAARTGALALVLGVALARPALGAGPVGKATATASTELNEAERLTKEAARLRGQGKYDDALPLAQRALAIREKALDPSDRQVAASLGELALLYVAKGEHGRAEPMHQRALAIREKALGPSHPDVATSLDQLADLYVSMGDFARTEPLLLRALAIQEKALGALHPDVATSLDQLGDLYRAKGDAGRAEPLLLRALAIRQKALGENHPQVAEVLNNLGAVYLAGGDYGRAEPLLLRGLAIREKALGPDHPDLVYSLNNLATLRWTKADYAGAERLFVRGLAIREKALGPFHPQVAESLGNLASVAQETGELARAEPLYQRALAILEKALGPDNPTVAIILGNLAELNRLKGDYARAEPLYQRSLAILEKTAGPDALDVAFPLNNLASLYLAKGDYGRAERLYQRALAIMEKVLGPSHPNLASSLSNLAGLYELQGDYGRAEPLHQRALAIREKALGPFHPDVAGSLNNLGKLYRDKGDLGRAEPLLLRAIAIQEKALGPDHPDLGAALNNLGDLYSTRGDLGRAEPFFRRAIAIQEKALGPFHPDLATTLHNVALLSLGQGRLPQAMSESGRAADIRDRNASLVLATGSEDQKRLYMGTLVDETYADISQHVQYAPASRDAARLALTVVLRRKGRILDAMTDSLAALRRSLDPGDRAVLDRLTAVYARLTTLVSRGPGQATAEHYRKELAALEQERQTLEADVGQRSVAFRAEQDLLTLSEVQAKIPRGAALVEIARYAVLERSTGGPLRDGTPRYRYVAYVLHPTGDPSFADLGDAAPLEAAALALRGALGDPDLSHDPRPAARALDRLLMAPVRALLGEARWVFLSPDGALNLVPFGALLDEQGHYLVERTLFSYVTSGRDLLRFGEDHARSLEAPLILANPAFDDSSVAPGPEATHREVRSIDMVTRALPPLESTAAEARTIARLFPDSRVLLRAQATEEAVEAARAPRFLHLATHGFFLPELPLPEALRSPRPGAEPTPSERAELLARENPLLRSGVALAGFNRRKSGSDAGVLTALEAAGLDLHGTRLVVLSACETGLGEASTGEGVYGMRRALTMAGAETQVMSLWKVDTGRTRELMEAYYRQLKDGAGRSEAMRAVQLAMLADPKTASPNLWAGFIVSGEWRTLDGAPRLPEVGRVLPGARGCACGQAGGEPRGHGWLALAIGLLVRRRRTRRPQRAPGCTETTKSSKSIASSRLAPHEGSFPPKNVEK